MTKDQHGHQSSSHSADPAQRAVTVGVLLAGENEDRLHDDLDELESLLSTLGVDVAHRVVQKRSKFAARALIGEGKVEEVRDLAEAAAAGLVVFDHSLSAPQVRNLEKMTGKAVLDRTGVILEIFARHARTNQAKTQVEIAQLEYMLPRMAGAWTHFQRQTGGGVRARGMGEKQIEVDRRRARERIARLRSQLEQIQKEKRVQRKARHNELKVALVGYTNSGKTTLMSAMTKADVDPEDVLFATLDASVRTLDPSTRPRILLSDTVGFIRNLPHGLVESFKSTLDEVLEADLLLHVVDVSHKNYKEHMATTDAVLKEIGAGQIPTIMVFNKIDGLDDKFLPRILRQAYPDSICVSALNEEDVRVLRRHVFGWFERTLVRAWLEVPPGDQTAMSMIYKSCLILDSDFNDPEVARFEVRASNPVISKLAAYRVAEPTK